MLLAIGKEDYVEVDDDDFEVVNQWQWQLCNGYVSRDIRVGRNKKKKIYMHRQLAGVSRERVRIRNGNRLDLRRSNIEVLK